MKKTTLALTILTLTAGFVSSISASTISPVDIRSNTRRDLFQVSNLISRQGLTGPDPQLHYYDDFNFAPNRENLWVTRSVGVVGNLNYFASHSSPVLTIDLGDDYSLDAIYLWAYAFGAFRPNTYQGSSVRDFELIFNTSTEGTVFSGPAEFSATMAHGKILPGGRPRSSDTEPRQDFLFSSPVQARFIQMRILSNYAGFDGHAWGGDRVGMSEIQFSTREVPEPASIFTAALGMILLIISKPWFRTVTPGLFKA